MKSSPATEAWGRRFLYLTWPNATAGVARMGAMAVLIAGFATLAATDVMGETTPLSGWKIMIYAVFAVALPLGHWIRAHQPDSFSRTLPLPPRNERVIALLWAQAPLWLIWAICAAVMINALGLQSTPLLLLQLVFVVLFTTLVAGLSLLGVLLWEATLREVLTSPAGRSGLIPLVLVTSLLSMAVYPLLTSSLMLVAGVAVIWLAEGDIVLPRPWMGQGSSLSTRGDALRFPLTKVFTACLLVGITSVLPTVWTSLPVGLIGFFTLGLSWWILDEVSFGPLFGFSFYAPAVNPISETIPLRRRWVFVRGYITALLTGILLFGALWLGTRLIPVEASEILLGFGTLGIIGGLAFVSLSRCLFTIQRALFPSAEPFWILLTPLVVVLVAIGFDESRPPGASIMVTLLLLSLLTEATTLVMDKHREA